MDLTKLQGVVNNIKSMELWANGATGLLNPSVVNNLSSAINGLNLQQAQLVLSTRNLTKEQMNQVFVQAGLIASENKIQAELVQSVLAQSGLSAEKQKAILTELDLMDATTLEMFSTKSCTKEKLLNTLATQNVTGANAEAIISTLGLTSANEKVTLSFGLFSKATWTQVKAQLALMAANPITWILALVGTVFGVSKAFDALTVSFDEAVEKTKSSKEKLDQLTSEISDLNNELKTTGDRIDELVEKANNGTISLLEEEELNNLKAQNDELQREIALKEKLVEIDAKEAAENASKSITYKTDDNHWDDEYNPSDRIDKLQEYVDTANLYQNKISEVNQNILGIEESATDSSYKNDPIYKNLIERRQQYQKELQKTEELMSSTYKELTDEDDGLYYNGKVIKGYEALDKRLDNVYASVELYLDDGSVEDTIEEYKTSIKNKLLETGLSGEISNAVVEGFSEEELNSIINSNSIDWNKCLGLDNATAVIENIKDQITSVVNTNETSPLSSSITETIDQLNTQLKPTFDSLKSAYQDIFTTDDDGKPLFTLENVDLSMLDSIKSTLDELNENEELGINIDYSSFENLARILTDTSSTEQQVRDSFNALADDIVNTLTPSFSEVSSESLQLIETLLRSLGIQNSEQVMIAALGYSYQQYTAAKQECADASFNLQNASQSEIDAFVNEQIASDSLGQSLAQLELTKVLVNNTAVETQDDINRILSLAQAAGIGAEALGKLAQFKTDLENETDPKTRQWIMKSINEYTKTLSQEIQNVQVDFTPKADTSKSKSKSKGSDKKETDKWLEEYKKKLAELQNQLDKGKRKCPLL